MALLEDQEFVLTIDSLRSVTLNVSDTGTFVLALEDPRSVAIVEMNEKELSELHAEIGKRLKR